MISIQVAVYQDMRLISLIPRLLPCRKTEREPGRSDHMGQYDVSRRSDNRLSHVWISTFSAHCVIVIQSYTALVLTFPIVRLFCKPHPSQMRLARLIARLEEQLKLLEGRLGRVLSHCSPPSRFNVSLNCVLGGAQDCICMDDLFSTYYNLL